MSARRRITASVDFSLPRLPSSTPDAFNQMAVATLPEFAGPNSARMSTYQGDLRRPDRQRTSPGVSQRPGVYNGLTGPSYTLPGDQFRFNLPPTDVLRPNLDMPAGEIDTWPARSAGAKPMQANDPEEDKTKPKPRFLQQLESYIERELELLECPREGPSDQRLQVYREVFRYLIEDFKTYKPLLSAIKNEYELVVESQTEQLQLLQPLQSRLSTVQQEVEQRIGGIRREHSREIQSHKEANARLQEKVLELSERADELKVQVDKLSSELTNEHGLYLEQVEARKMLVSQVHQLEQYKAEKEHDDARIQHNWQRMEAQLQRIRLDHQTAMRENKSLRDTLADVVPRADFDAAEAKGARLDAELKSVKTMYASLVDQHHAVTDMLKSLTAERENAKGTTTPRPDFDVCGDFVRGGREWWDKNAHGRSTKEQLDIVAREFEALYNEAHGKFQSTNEDFFEGLGTGPTVPKYLRHLGKVKNRRMQKRDTEILIKEVWADKIAHEAKNKREQLDNFLFAFLQRKYGTPVLAIEWGYNLHDACQRFLYDADIELFFRILTGDLDEEVYHNQMAMIEKLKNAFARLDIGGGNGGKEGIAPSVSSTSVGKGPGKGRLLKRDLMDALRKFFPFRSDKLLQELEDALNEDQPGEYADYRTLFSEDKDGNQGAFAEELRDQHIKERIDYVRDIEEAVHHLYPHVEEITVEQAKEAVLSFDTNKPPKELQQYLARGFGLPLEQLNPDSTVALNLFVKRLQSGMVRRSTKKGGEEGAAHSEDRPTSSAETRKHPASARSSRSVDNRDDEDSKRAKSPGTGGRKSPSAGPGGRKSPATGRRTPSRADE